MLGAIIGDLVGSIYEFPEYQDLIRGTINVERRKSIFDQKPEEFLNEKCFFSDDTVLTVAIADAIVNEVPYADKLKEYGLRYLTINKNKPGYFESSFSANFQNWLKGHSQGYSTGNGAGMRVSPVGFLFNSETLVCNEAWKCTVPSHNTTSAINGAIAIAYTILKARLHFSKEEIKVDVSRKFKYDLDLELENLRQTNLFNPTCEVTVPQAIFAFLESTSFENAIKIAVSIGGDTDTIACMTGAMAEAYYGIPHNLVKHICDYNIPQEFFDILSIAYSKMEENQDKILI